MTAWIQTHLLSFLVFGPAFVGLALLLVPKRQAPVAKLVALLASLAFFLIGTLQLFKLPQDAAGVFISERFHLFTAVNIPVEYHLAADGLNFWLILLTLFLVPITFLGTWNSFKDREGTAFALFLMLITGVLGAFTSQDLFVFYLFWEAMLLPMYFLIGVWGGDERKYAANKFMLYTLAGSLLWLVALLYIGGKAGSFAPGVMAQAALALPFKTQAWLFVAFTLAFAIKVPLFPLHTWLPDAHVQAPTAGSVILAGVLLKLGGYGFLKFALPIFPVAALAFAKPLAILSVIAIVYGALIAMVQPDIKKLVAYSSVSHMGFVMLGLVSFTTVGVQGAILQMLNHGISTGALFLLVGFIYDRAHTRQIADFGGVAGKMPIYTGFFLVITLSSIGLPLTNGFVGEFLILNGTFLSGLGFGRAAAVVSCLGIVLGAVYMLWMVKRVFWGAENTDPASGTAHLHDDLNVRELAVMVPLVLFVFWMGLRPSTFLAQSQGQVQRLLKDAGAPAQRTFTPAPAPVHHAPEHASPEHTTEHAPAHAPEVH